MKFKKSFLIWDSNHDYLGCFPEQSEKSTELWEEITGKLAVGHFVGANRNWNGGWFLNKSEPIILWQAIKRPFKFERVDLYGHKNVLVLLYTY